KRQRHLFWSGWSLAQGLRAHKYNGLFQRSEGRIGEGAVPRRGLRQWIDMRYAIEVRACRFMLAGGTEFLAAILLGLSNEKVETGPAAHYALRWPKRRFQSRQRPRRRFRPIRVLTVSAPACLSPQSDRRGAANPLNSAKAIHSIGGSKHAAQCS